MEEDTKGEKQELTTQSETPPPSEEKEESPPISEGQEPEEAQDALQKKKKINKMNLEQVEKAIQKTEKHMHALSSKYAQALLSRKAELEEQQKSNSALHTINAPANS